MKVVILAGGLGSRLSEATSIIPKPMVEIGGKPILWHIMKANFHWKVNWTKEVRLQSVCQLQLTGKIECDKMTFNQ